MKSTRFSACGGGFQGNFNSAKKGGYDSKELTENI